MEPADSSKRALPDPSKWEPRNASQTLGSAFAEECRGAEQRLLQSLSQEKKLAIDNFDSGVPFEEIVRHEIGRLLPNRYSVNSGLVLDRKGKTAGGCDLVIFNDFWFAPIKPPVTHASNRRYLPIEGVFAVGEVKQTLSSKSLDEAMEKLVKCQRLYRPRTYAHRIVENREGSCCPHGLTNPLFTFVLAAGVSPGETLQSLIERFFDISKQLKRLEVVRALCVLGAGIVVWSFRDPDSNEVRPALFVRDDLFHPIFPMFSTASDRCPLLLLLQFLQQSLFHTVLGPEDLAFAYALDGAGIKTPSDPRISLPVEKEWSDLLDTPCRHERGI